MEAVMLGIFGGVNILCFLVGAWVGQRASRGERVELPRVNPMEAVRIHREKKEAQEEQGRVDAILRNIEAYDGTPFGQEDISGR